MLVKLYGLFWVLLAVAAGTIVATASFDAVTLTTFGFAFGALVFTGLVGVLPWWMEKHYSRYQH